MKRFGWICVGLFCAVGGAILPGMQPPVATASVAAIASSSQSTVTQNQVRRILDQTLAAANRRDTEGIARFLAPKATIVMTIRSFGGTETLRLNREQYLRYNQQGMRLVQDYNARMTNLKIQVAANRKSAIATYTLTEQTTVAFNNQSIPMVASSNTQATFELVGGKVLVTAIAATTTVTPQQTI